MAYRFTKVEGAGNDFVLVDNMEGKYKINLPEFTRAVCPRKTSIGADGLLVLEKSKKADFKMRIFNPDGSEVDMCGNGARCCGYYFADKDEKKEVRFETLSGMMKAEVTGKDMIGLYMGPPTKIKLDMLINIDKNQMSCSYINTGVPHVIVETDKLEDTEVDKLGRAIRYNNEFAPEGTNADFVRVTGKSDITIRTYERGVEAETRACGTGAVASAIIQSLRGKVKSPVKVTTRGGDLMKVHFTQSDKEDLISKINNVVLEGPARLVFSGEIENGEKGDGTYL
ncbi:MAG: diaminopimelate epimerase [Elusimicrobiota bacterium]|nr:diaminopimelate epimerase [Elusimicrobiota bacterium]